MADFHDTILVDMRLHSLAFYLMGMQDGEISYTRLQSFPLNYKKEGKSEALDLPSASAHFKAGLALAAREAPNANEIVLIGLGRNYCLMNEDIIVEPFYLVDGRIDDAVIREIDLQISYPLRYVFSGSEEGKNGSFYRLVVALKKGKLKEATDFLFPIEYLFYRMTGEKAHDNSLARTNGFIDIHNNRYSNALVHGAGIPIRFLPELVESFTHTGKTNEEYSLVAGREMTVRLGASRNYSSNFMIPDLDDTIFIRFGDSPCIGAHVKAPFTEDEMREIGYRTGYAKGLPALEKRLHVGNLINHFLNQNKLIAPALDDAVRASRFSHTINYASGKLSKADDIKKAIDEQLSSKKLDTPKTDADYLRCLYLSLAEYLAAEVDDYQRILDVHWGRFVLLNAEADTPFLKEVLSRKLGKEVDLAVTPCEVKGAYVATLDVRAEEERKRKEMEEEEE